MSAVYTVFLTIGLLISGVTIPLILTYQDNQKIYQDDDTFYFFTQPLLQTTMIFLGEILCILVIHLVTRKPSSLDQSSSLENAYNEYNSWPETSSSVWAWSNLWFILPSAFDLIATTLLNLGLFYTSPSVYQMLKSSIVGFSAIFSALFLSRKFLFREWFSIIAIVLGTSLVLASAICKDVHDYTGPTYLIVAQFFVASQFILEEFLMEKLHLDPVKAMGIEGIFGTILLSGGLTIAAFFGEGVFDVRQGFYDVISSYNLWQSALVLAASVAIFNFFGLAVSTIIGVPGRSFIDTLRTILTWAIAIHYGWDIFTWFELSGFLVLVLGVFIFNGVFIKLKTTIRGGDERTPLLS